MGNNSSSKVTVNSSSLSFKLLFLDYSIINLVDEKCVVSGEVFIGLFWPTNSPKPQRHSLCYYGKLRQPPHIHI